MAETLTLGKALNPACAARWRTTPRSSSWARTSASSAASSGSPTACRRTSARSGSSTPRWPSPASSAPRSAWRSAATGRCARSSSTGSSTRRTTRSCRQVAKMHYRSQGKVRLPIVIRIPFGGGIGAVEHHSESPEAYFAHTAGLKVVACSNPADAYWMIQQAIAVRRPDHLLRAEAALLGEGRGRHRRRRCPTRTRCTPRGSSGPGTDATVLAYGPMVRTALDAADGGRRGRAASSRSSTCARSRRWTSARSSSRCAGPAGCVVVHEAPGNLGLGAEIAARITEECFYSLEAPVLRVTGFDTPVPGRPRRGGVPARPRPGARRRRPLVRLVTAMTRIKEFNLPDLGEGLTEGEILKWLVPSRRRRSSSTSRSSRWRPRRPRSRSRRSGPARSPRSSTRRARRSRSARRSSRSTPSPARRRPAPTPSAGARWPPSRSRRPRARSSPA